MPTWVAASPMPTSVCIVSIMSSSKRSISGVTSRTCADRRRSTGSP
jgi:hypothetical protein